MKKLTLALSILVLSTACATEEWRACGCSDGEICVMDPFDAGRSLAENIEENGACREIPVACEPAFPDDLLDSEVASDACKEALCTHAEDDEVILFGSFSQGSERFVECEYTPDQSA